MPTHHTIDRPGIDWPRAQALLAQERLTFENRNPLSKALAGRAGKHLMFGVPLHWMNDWGTPFALQVASAQGAQLTDLDGHSLADFCLGDTGAMFGHSPAAVTQALQRQAAKGLTTMLPSTQTPPPSSQRLSRSSNQKRRSLSPLVIEPPCHLSF